MKWKIKEDWEEEEEEEHDDWMMMAYLVGRYRQREVSCSSHNTRLCFLVIF
jgi:hypothetical protein